MANPGRGIGSWISVALLGMVAVWVHGQVVTDRPAGSFSAAPTQSAVSPPKVVLSTSPAPLPVPLNTQRPAQDSTQQTKPQTQNFNRQTVIEQIIKQSVSEYPGNCPCPYNSDRVGRSCGRRSAYSRPGGYAPICYAKDVTNEMIQTWQRTH